MRSSLGRLRYLSDVVDPAEPCCAVGHADERLDRSPECEVLSVRDELSEEKWPEARGFEETDE